MKKLITEIFVNYSVKTFLSYSVGDLSDFELVLTEFLCDHYIKH